MKSITMSGKLNDGRHARIELYKYGGGYANLALVAHKSRRVANDWVGGRKRGKKAKGAITGTGYEVFAWAFKMLTSNQSWIRSHNISTVLISIDCGDKRLSAYKKLLKRYKVFWRCFKDGDGDVFIAIDI